MQTAVVGAAGLALACLVFPSAMPSWRSVVVVGGGAVVAGVVALYKFQDRLLYQPGAMPQFMRPRDNPSGMRSPDEWNMPYEDVELRTHDGVRLSAWMMKQAESTSVPTMIFFQANAGNMGWRLPNIAQLYRKLNCNVFAVSYRGYGDSDGTPSEVGLMHDADATISHLLNERTDIDTTRLIVFGRSLGGAVAMYVAHKYNDQIKATVIENTFSNIGDMVDTVFPLLAPLKPFVLCIDWPSSTRVQHITHPILFISGSQDEIVPSHHMQQLYDRAHKSSRKEMYRVQNGTHNDTWMKGGSEYLDTVHRFVREHSS